MENILNKQQNISLSGDVASRQNGASGRTTKMVVIMERTTLMHAVLRFSTNFGQC